MDERRAATWRRDYDLVAQAIALLEANREAQPSVERLATALYVSPGHLHRTFARFAGVSPHRFLRWLTYGAARDLLRTRATVLDTAEATGLSSPGRVHDLAVTMEGVTPGELGRGGAGLAIRFGVHPTRLGDALVATTERGVLALRFLDGQTREAAVVDLTAAWPAADLHEDLAATAPVVDHLDAVLLSRPDGPRSGAVRPLGVLAVGTNLQLKVWEALLRLPDDAVISYAEVARAADRPGAVRAVANAVGRNPVEALIPCHRVLRSTGELGGYRWGTTRKRALLALEAVRGDRAAPGGQVVAADIEVGAGVGGPATAPTAGSAAGTVRRQASA